MEAEPTTGRPSSTLGCETGVSEVPALEIEDVSKVFASGDGLDVRALDSVSFSARAHEFVSILGPSGCGKSTLLYIIAGLIDPTTGTVNIAGRKINGPGKDRCVVFQEFALYPWRTVLRNITFGLELTKTPPHERREEAMRFVELVGLRGFENHLPHQLSGGMRQRVAIARALVLNPDVLLMDEPFGALDAFTRELMQDELMNIWELTQKTIIFVTHSVDEALLLSDGIVVMSARPGGIREVLSVEFSRPRNGRDLHGDPQYVAMRRHLLDLLRDESQLRLRREG